MTPLKPPYGNQVFSTPKIKQKNKINQPARNTKHHSTTTTQWRVKFLFPVFFFFSLSFFGMSLPLSLVTSFVIVTTILNLSSSTFYYFYAQNTTTSREPSIWKTRMQASLWYQSRRFKFRSRWQCSTTMPSHSISDDYLTLYICGCLMDCA